MPLNRARLLAAFTLLATACGLDLIGTQALDGGLDAQVPDGQAPDGFVQNDADAGDADADADAETPDACAGSCPATTFSDSAFSPVLFGDGTVACPSGFDTDDTIENPTAKAGSCTCGACNVTATCNSGSVDSLDGNNANSCNSNNYTFQLNNGGCNALNAQWGTSYATVTTPTAKNLACTASGAANTPAVDQYTKTSHRVCAPQAAICRGSLCESDAGAFQVCLATQGSNACPAGFPVRHAVGKESALTLACAACQCTNATATCTGTLSYYANGGCIGTAHPIPAGTCTNVGQDNYQSYQWGGSVAPGATCTKTPAPTATVTMPTSEVICCPN